MSLKSQCALSQCLFVVYSDGKLEIVVPSFVHYLEVLEGADGDKMPGMISLSLCLYPEVSISV